MARVAVGLLTVGAAAIPLWARSATPLMHARMADGGGWSPEALQARVGEPLRLRLTSDDVTHGFAVGQMDMQGVDVEPGKVSEVTLVFDKPGTYTFYCTRWCGVNHWRMRGTIQVAGNGPAPAASVPLYVKLGLDLDARRAAPAVPQAKPGRRSPEASAAASVSALEGVEFYRSHSPYEAWSELRGNPALAGATDQQVWDMVAFVWQSNTTPEAVAEGRRLFQQNCAACHGAGGAGNGVFADALATRADRGLNTMVQRPANLADPQRMLAASPALLAGKIVRGGMGTGMPAWGPILTEEQVWKIVSYLYTFQFEEIGP